MGIRTKKILLYCLMFFFILIATSPIYLSWIINSKTVKNRVAAIIYEKTDQQLEIKDFTIGLFPHPKVAIQNVAFSPESLSGNVVVETINIEFDATQLLRGQFYVKQISLVHPVFSKSFFKKEARKPDESHSTTAPFPDMNAILSFLPFPQDELKIIIKNADSPFFHQLDINAVSSRKKSQIDVNATVSKINLTPSKFFPPKLLSADLGQISMESIQFSGIIDSDYKILGTSALDKLKVFQHNGTPILDSATLESDFSLKNGEYQLDTTAQNISINPSGFLSREDLPENLGNLSMEKIQFAGTIGSDYKIHGSSSMDNLKVFQRNSGVILNIDTLGSDFSLENGEYKIDIKPVKLTYPDAIFGMSFASSRVHNKSAISFHGTQINIDETRQAGLDLFGNNEVTQILFEIIQAGKSPRIQVDLKSRRLEDLFHEDNLSLSGSILNGVINIPETTLTAKKVYGKVRLQKGVLFIDTANGLIGNSTIETGQLQVDLLNYIDYPFEGVFGLDVSLPQLPEILISLLPDTLLADELKIVSEVIGRCKASLDLSLATGSEDLVVKVRTEQFSAKGKYDRIPGNILLENIQFDYVPDTITLQHLTGTVNGNHLENIHCVIHLNEPLWLDILSGSADVMLSNTISWINKYPKAAVIISPIRHGSGYVRLDQIKLSGPATSPEKWEFDVQGQGDNLSLSTHPENKEIDNLFVDFSATNHAYSFDNITFVSHNFDWFDAGSHSDTLKQIVSPLYIKDGELNISNSEATFKSTIDFPGDATTTVNLAGKAPVEMDLIYIRIIDPDISDATIVFPSKVNNSGLNFSGKLDTTTLTKILNPKESWAKTLSKITQQVPWKIESTPTSQFLLKTRSLDLDTILSFYKQSSSSGSSLPDTDILFRADKVTYKKFMMTDVHSRIKSSSNDINVQLRKCSFCDLPVKGTIQYKDGLLLVDIPFKTHNGNNIQDLFSCLFKKDNFMDGRYSLTTSFTSIGLPEKIKEHFNGDLAFSATDGRIYKLTLLSRILSVLNVSSVFKGKIPDITQEGFAYDTVIIEGDIQDSVITLNKAIIDGRDMTLIFQGIVDPVNDSLELDCLVAPFKTIDLIIEKIPVINTIFKGRLLSVPVNISGKLSDPIVVPLHPSAVGNGLINMMIDIVKAPVRLFDEFMDDSEKND